ncbi:MAG: DUF4129 domain-containing protein [Propionibacteriaceae bacterium]
MALAAALLVLAVVGAALAPPWRLEERTWPAFNGPAMPNSERTPPPMPSWANTPITSNSNPANLSWVVPTLIALAVLAALVLLWWLRRRYLASGVERRGAREVGETVLLPVQPELPVLRRGAEAAQRSLDEIRDPNNAIVAAWLALEEAAASSGVQRKPAETPSEFTVDVLGSTDANPEATQELLTLYHRARFSSAGVTRADVYRAGDCLAVLADDWAAMTSAAVNAALDAAHSDKFSAPGPPSARP